MITGVSGESLLMDRRTSIPLESGRLISSRTRSKGSLSNFLSPSAAVVAVTVSYRSVLRSASRLSRTSASSSMMRIEPVLGDIDRFPGGGEFQTERCSAADRTVDENLPGVFTNDAVTYRQTKSRTAVSRLCGEEGVKDLTEIFRGNAHAVVGEFNRDSGIDRTGCHNQFPAVRHCIAGVHNQVHEDLLQLAGVPMDKRKVRVEIGPDADFGGTQHRRHERECFLNHLVEV